MVCWGLVNIANIYFEEGQMEKALDISLAINSCPMEIKIVQEEIVCLLENLKAALPQGLVETAMKQANCGASQEQARANVLAYVQNHEGG
jgi:hypothetical protein